MRRTHRKTLLAMTLMLAAWAVPEPARAVGRGPYSVEILVDGVPIAEYAARGTTYVEALRGREYAVRLRNDSDRRVAVALSVDGLNSIDAKTTTAAEARKWIVEPWSSITLEGWQTSAATARKFYFTGESDSYGAWLGRTRNLGVIAAAFFRERRPEPPVVTLGEAQRDAPAAGADPRCRKSVANDSAATGIGREVGHRVREVDFVAEDAPPQVLELRYEYRDALVRLGVLPRLDDPLARRESARGFEDDGFAPDPYRRRPR